MVFCRVFPANKAPISLRSAELPVSYVEEALQPNMMVLCPSKTVRLKVRRIELFSFNVFYCCDGKSESSADMTQASVPRELSEIILIC